MNKHHYSNETRFRYREHQSSTRAARCVTSVLVAATLLALINAERLIEPVLQISQRAAMQRTEPVRVDLNTEPVHVEKNWIIMTAPQAQWILNIEKPEPQPPIKEQPEAAKPVKKIEKNKPVVKPKPQPVQPVKVVQSVGSAAQADQDNGSVKDVKAQELALGQIIALIEKHKRYPSRARSVGLEGKAVLSVSVDAAGVVQRVKIVSSTHPLFLRATLQASRKLPGLQTPMQKPVELQIPVVYQLH